MTSTSYRMVEAETLLELFDNHIKSSIRAFEQSFGITFTALPATLGWVPKDPSHPLSETAFVEYLDLIQKEAFEQDPNELFAFEVFEIKNRKCIPIRTGSHLAGDAEFCNLVNSILKLKNENKKSKGK